MKLRLLLVPAVAGLVLSGCGGEPTPAKPVPVEEGSAPVEEGATPSEVASADTLTFAKDGETIAVKVGEEVSVKLQLPGDAPSSVQWRPVDKLYPDHVEELRTYRSVEGKEHYSDVILKGVRAGSGSVTLAIVDKGTPVDEGRVTLTLAVE